MKYIILLLILFSVSFAQMKLDEIIKLSNSGQTNLALKEINSFLDINQNEHRAYFIKALILTEKKEFSNAVSILDNAIAISETNAEYYRLAGQLNENLNRISKAVSSWNNCKKYATGALKGEAEKHLQYLTNE